MSTPVASAWWAITPEARKEIVSLQKELREVGPLLRKKQNAQAAELVQNIRNRMQQLNIGDDEKDRAWLSLKAQFERAAQSLPVSFVTEIAPILREQCERCHSGNQPAGRLRLDTFSQLTRGGQSGAFLKPGAPQQSMVLSRLMSPDPQQRMPREGERLSDEQLSLFARWISQGAPFDGDNREAALADLQVVAGPSEMNDTAASGESRRGKKSRSDKSKSKIIPESTPPTETNGPKVTLADGSETVSFKETIAPILVNICLNCHSGETPQGELNVTTFRQLLKGGKTGNTIVPGKPDDSYLIDLVLRQDPMKMPQGQAQLKRSEAEAFETWIREGAHFDGTDPGAPLRSLVPTAEELEAKRLAAMSDDEHRANRDQQAVALWKRISPRNAGASLRTEHLLLHGDIAEARLKELGDVAEQQLRTLREEYGGRSEPRPKRKTSRKTGGAVEKSDTASSVDTEQKPETAAGSETASQAEGEGGSDPESRPWRGGLIIFVTKDRFEYEEFNTVLMNGRRTPETIHGHIVVTANQDEAYVAMHDVGEESSKDALGASDTLRSLVSQAYISRQATTLPDWLLQGFGISAALPDGDSDYLKALPEKGLASIRTLASPDQLFAGDTFAPDEVTAVGYVLVRFLSQRGGASRYRSFLDELQKSGDVAAAMQKTWKQSPEAIARDFLKTSLRSQ
jgi:hypothetical protein